MLETYKERWLELDQREQMLSLACALIVVIGLLYWAAWQPLSDARAEAEQQLKKAESSLVWVQEKSTILAEAGIQGQGSSKNKQRLSQVVNRSAKQNGITFSRVVNKKEKLEVWINDVEFNRFVRWLTSISNQYGISVETADLAKTKVDGVIKVNRLLLTY